MKELNFTKKLVCKELNECQIDTIDYQEERNCTDALACYNFLVWSKGKSCLNRGCFLTQKEIQIYCLSKVNIKIKNNEKNGFEGFCCNEFDLCNKIEKDSTTDNFLFEIIIFSSILVLIFFLVFFLKKKKFKKRRNINKDKDLFNENNSLKYITSGSGAGFPLLIERTLTKEICLETLIGKGKFGEVWKGNYQNRKVAVKKFYTTDYDSWKKETEVYDHYSLANEFILKYLGSDITSSESFTTEFWIVLDYHELGSLYDYLQRSFLSKEQVLSIIYSFIFGIAHLHDIFEFTSSKPGIAHRDLKSKNLLMKSDSVVCIADFGLSITSKGIETNQYEHLNLRVGTKRYMAPEILDETLDIKSFESFQKADIYSFSLILWEIIIHSQLNENLANYKPPYSEYTGDDPSFDEMKRIVVLEELRPSIDFLKELCLNGTITLKNLKPNEEFDQTKKSIKLSSNSKLEKNLKTFNCLNKNFNNVKEDKKLTFELIDLIKNCWKSNALERYNYIQIRQKFIQIINQK